MTEVFVVVVTMISPTPTPVIIPLRTYDSITSCETAGKAKVASLTAATPGQTYIFNCFKFQVGP